MQDIIHPVRSPIHTDAHINTPHVRSVCSGMRLIYLWTHVSRAHVHVYQMNFIGLCARLCMATSRLCICASHVRLCIVFQRNDTFNWNWQMNLSSIWNESKWKPHRKLLPSLMCVDDILSITFNRLRNSKIRLFSLLVSVPMFEWCFDNCLSAYTHE